MKEYLLKNSVENDEKCIETIKEESYSDGIIVSFEMGFYTNNNNLNKRDLLYKKSISRYCIPTQILQSKGCSSVEDIIYFSKEFKISLLELLTQLSSCSTHIELQLPYKSVVLKRTAVYESENPIRVIIDGKNYSKYFLDLVVFKGRKIETAESCIFGTLSANDKLEITNDNVVSLYEKLGYMSKEKNSFLSFDVENKKQYDLSK